MILNLYNTKSPLNIFLNKFDQTDVFISMLIFSLSQTDNFRKSKFGILKKIQRSGNLKEECHQNFLILLNKFVKFSYIFNCLFEVGIICKEKNLCKDLWPVSLRNAFQFENLEKKRFFIYLTLHFLE